MQQTQRTFAATAMSSPPSVYAQDLGPYPSPAPSCTVLSSVDGGHAYGGAAAGGGWTPADPAAQEELFVNTSGTSAVWRTLGGQIAHTSFRSVVLGPTAAIHGGRQGDGQENGGPGAIVQAIRCRFPTMLEGWSSQNEQEGRESEEEKRRRHRQRQERRKGPWSVCILRNPDLVTIHHPTGHSYEVTLPCEARLLRPLGDGLLVQRFAEAGGGEDHAPLSSREESDEDESVESLDGVPSLFTLSHPLDDLRPVALLPPRVGRASFRPSYVDEHQQRLVCDPLEKVVFARGSCDAGGKDSDTSLLLTYHTGRRQHSLWLVLPAPELEGTHDSKPCSPSAVAAGVGDGNNGDASVLGAMMNQSPGEIDSWRATTGLSTPLAADTSNLSSTLLGISALDSPSSVAGLSVIDAVLAAGQPRRDRLSVGGSTRAGGGGGSTGRGRLSLGGGGGGARRASSGSNASWIGAGNTRNEALASALGLGQSALGVAPNLLSLSAAGGPGGVGDRGGGADPFHSTMIGGGGFNAGSSMALSDKHALGLDEDDEDEAAAAADSSHRIRPRMGLSLVWREADESPEPARHVFCASVGTPSPVHAAEGASYAPFLLCLVEGQAARLRALTVSKTGETARIEFDAVGAGVGVKVTEAFAMPCASAVGLCATGGGDGEGTPGSAIAADILVLAPDRSLTLHRGEKPITQIAIPAVEEAQARAVVAPDSAGGHDAQGDPDAIDLISDAVGSCFTLTTVGGTRRRLRLSLEPASPLVAACLGAWDCLLSPLLSASLRTDVVSAAHALTGKANQPASKALSGEGREGPPVSNGEADLDWVALVAVIRELVLGGVNPSKAATPNGQRDNRFNRQAEKEGGHPNGGTGKNGIGDDHAWISLLSSPFHDRFSRDNAMLLSGLDQTRVELVKGLHETRFEAPQIFSAFPPPPPPPQQQQQQHQRKLHTRRAVFIAEVGAVFDALHLVLEDLKTSRLTMALVPRLASLLLSLTRAFGEGGRDMLDFADHYWRDAAGCGQGDGETVSMIHSSGQITGRSDALPSRPTSFQKVPCIRKWVHTRIRTGQIRSQQQQQQQQQQQGQERERPSPAMISAAPQYVLGEDGPFPTLSKNHGALQGTRRFCRFYTILCDGASEEGSRPGMGVEMQLDGNEDDDDAGGMGASGGGVESGRTGKDNKDWVGARLVSAMVGERFGVEDLERAPLGLTLPLLELLHAASSQAPADWPVAAQDLVGRQDLSALRRMLKADHGDLGGWDAQSEREEQEDEEEGLGEPGGYWAGGRISSSATGGTDSAVAGGIRRGEQGGFDQMGGGGRSGRSLNGGAGGGSGGGGEGSELDGLAWVDELSSLRFGRDRRVREVCRLLRGSRPVRFNVERSPESSDHDHQQRQQARLLQLAMRTLAGPAGRGMLTLGTLAPLLAEPLPIPPLCLAGRIRKPADVVVNLDLAAAAVPPDTTAWAEFHNGVAAGLRLQHEWGFSEGDGSSSSGRADGGAGAGGGDTVGGFEAGGVSRTWITYNRPAGGANNAHGGLLMALGLQGHLSSLAMTDVFEYLTLGQESTTVGVLLGMAAARRGSADLSTHKMLCLHVPSLLPHPFADMDTSSVTQAAALAGVGLLYQGTSHRLMTEFLLGEMGRSPCSDRFADREGYALACGLSLGMINLGKGASGGMAGVADLKLEQQLHRYMSGGKDASTNSGGIGPGGDSAGANNLGGGPRRGPGSRGGGATSGGGGGPSGHESSGPSRISPGEYVNTDVTAPAALVGLALIYVRSEDRALAARLGLPQTHFQLDYVRPEQLLLRVVVRGLVMWNEVRPTEEWVESQIPEVVRVEHARLHEPLPEELASVVDRQTIRQAHANIIAGACLCLGLRFAGTADERARATVLSRVRHFKSLRDSVGGSSGGGGSGAGGRDPTIAACRPQRPVLEMCLSTSVTALGMIMAGTGDLESLRVMRELRSRVEFEVTYGTHMAIAMAIGLLFLGGGMASLGRENEHIAALLGAFFPRYPASPDDNQYHLQALRHLYVLAVQRRGVDAVDVDTGESLFVPLTVVLRVGEDDNNDTGNAIDDQGYPGGGVNDTLSSLVTPMRRPNGAHRNGNNAAGDADDTQLRTESSRAGNKLSLLTPCVLPDLKEVSRISINSPRYFPVDLDIIGNRAIASTLRRRCRIYVKRRVGHLSYKNDPHALRSLLFQSYPGAMGSAAPSALTLQHSSHARGHGHGHGHSHSHDTAAAGGMGAEDPVQSKADFLSAFTEDPHLLNFARHFCDSGAGDSGAGTGASAEGRGGTSGISSGRRLMLGAESLGNAAELARFFGGALLECLAGEKAEALGPHLSLCHSTVTARYTADASAAWDLRLVLDYGRGSALQTALAKAAASAATASSAPAPAAVAVVQVVGTTAGGGSSPDGDAPRTTRGRGKVETTSGEAEPPLPFMLLHPDLLASLEVRLDVFFSSLRIHHDSGSNAGTSKAAVPGTVGRRTDTRQSMLWEYLYDDVDGRRRSAGGTDLAAEHRLFGAYLSYFGIPSPVSLKRAIGTKEISSPGLDLADAPALLRHLPGLTPSALLKIISPAGSKGA